MKKLIAAALLLAGCAGAHTRFQVVCSNSPAPHNYPKPVVTCPCGNDYVVAVKHTPWGKRTYKVWDCQSTHRVLKWERIKGQD